MFSSSPNQLLFSTIEELIGQGLVPEVNLLDSHMKAKGKDLQIGGREYLNYLAKCTYDVANINEFEKMVIRSYQARTLISVVSKIPERIMETKDIDGAMAGLRVTLDKLSENLGGEDTEVLLNILQGTWTNIVERVEHPGLRGVTTGVDTVDSATAGMCEGEVWYIAGRPGMGKTAHMCNMMLAQGKAGIPALMFSFEMVKQSLAERLLALDTGINSFNLRTGALNQAELNRLSESIKGIKSLPIHVDSNFNGDINYITSTTRKYVRNYGVRVAYLDYIQLAAERGLDATNELGRISRQLKLLANELNITWVVGSQFNRLLETRDDKRPILSDLRQSGSLEEDADVVVGLYRDVVYNKKTKDPSLLEDIVLKNRNGPRGVIPLTFEEETGRIAVR
jgi:replicative DNA helicase